MEVTIEPAKPGTVKKKRGRRDYTLLLYAAPVLIYTIIFKFIPLVGWSLSFYEYKLGFKLSQLDFVGLKYFKYLVEDFPYIKSVLINTLAMSGLMLLNAPIAIFLSIMLNEVRSRKARNFVQTIITLPHFVSMVIVYSLFYAMFSYGGALNEILTSWNLIQEPLNILGNSALAWPFQFFVSVWKEVGWGTIVYLAAIAGIDQELYDAVEIDGCGRLGRILHITIPGIIPTFLVLLLLRLTSILNNGGLWEQVFVFMNPLIQEKVEILSYYTYRMGIVTGDYSYATTMDMLNSLISLMFLFGANALAKKLRGNSLI
ncbi:ABC transporter permease subunit [Paenibacillus cymbidii]|uniref:ABC transporter permease subunit n=1 Tax=Paenibacillus cymbidii TaxID=1639034 RepID=UPI001081B331|nr:ABC transporter permease subunit [Paenibacillus cymbidii]